MLLKYPTTGVWSPEAISTSRTAASTFDLAPDQADSADKVELTEGNYSNVSEQRKEEVIIPSTDVWERSLTTDSERELEFLDDKLMLAIMDKSHPPAAQHYIIFPRKNSDSPLTNQENARAYRNEAIEITMSHTSPPWSEKGWNTTKLGGLV